MTAILHQFRNGAWHSLATLESYRNAAWRRLLWLRVFTDGAWRQIATFAPALSVVIGVSDNIVYGPGGVPVGAYSIANAGVLGGVGPYSYSWSTVSGSVAFSSPMSASTAVSGSGTMRVTVTDASAQSATADYTL